MTGMELSGKMVETVLERHLLITHGKISEGGLEIRADLPIIPPWMDEHLDDVRRYLEERNYKALGRMKSWANLIQAAYLKFYPDMDYKAARDEIDNICDLVMEVV